MVPYSPYTPKLSGPANSFSSKQFKKNWPSIHTKILIRRDRNKEQNLATRARAHTHTQHWHKSDENLILMF